LNHLEGEHLLTHSQQHVVFSEVKASQGLLVAILQKTKHACKKSAFVPLLLNATI
jgi:hypothetical protein